MKKLFKLKKWLTLADSARYLSAALEEDVSEADVLLLALDGHLKLSVQFVNTVYANPVVPVDIKDVEYEVIPNLEGPVEIRITKGGRIFQDERGTFQVLKVITELDTDVWDIVLKGGARLDVEHAYQMKTGGPVVTDVNIDGDVMVENMKGGLLQLVSHFADNEHVSKNHLAKPWQHPDRFYPAGGLPDDSVLVVRTEALREFEGSINTAPASTEKPIATKERNTLLTIIAALCDHSAIKYQERGAANQIASMTQKIGAAVTDDTIRDVLKKVSDALESRMK